MKKTTKLKERPLHPQAGANLETWMSRIEQQLIHLERKIDNLIVRNAAKPAPPAPPQQIQAVVQRERQMFKAICADCGSPCEVPFKPSPERSIYCKPCFAARKAGYSGAKPVEAKSSAGGIGVTATQKRAAAGLAKKEKPVKKSKKK